MHPPSCRDVFAAIEATWPPRACYQKGDWMLRDGAGGGKRVSAATVLQNADTADIEMAAEEMRRLEQTPLFMIRNQDQELDKRLAVQGYQMIDPVVVLIAKTDDLLRQTPPAYDIACLEAPNTDAKTIWADGGIRQTRLDVMARVTCSKTILYAPGQGVAFTAAYQGISMTHAVEVCVSCRRKGVARALMQKAFAWAKIKNCPWSAVLTVRENIPAHSLYETLGMYETAAYHYRIKA